ncbi:hypothetical protein C0389_08210 [bacterium]|nr:hypothetical protein [bacterium]
MIILDNTIHWLEEQKKLLPSKAAIITEDSSLSYSEIWNECLCACNYFDQAGIQQKDHVGILFGHNYKFFIIVNALWMIGAVPVPLNTRNTKHEVECQLHQADIKHLIIDENISGFYSVLNFHNKIQISKTSSFGAFKKRIEILNSPTCLPAGRFSILNSSLIMFTSGSSGSAKAVVHNFKSLFESVNNMDSFANLGSSDVWLASLPFYHIGGFMILVRALISGGTIAIPNSLKHEDITKALTIFNPTHISIVSTMLGRFLNNEFVPSANLKFVFLGGGPASSAICLQAIDKGWPIAKVYGSTETCSMVAVLHPTEVKQQPDSAGKIFGSNKIMVRHTSSDESDKSCSVGEIGEIVVSSQSLFKEYYDDQLTTERVYRNGWHRTGDFGWLDEEGFLFISSRREDLIISGGENVSALEVENLIKTLDRIEDAFVFAIRDETWGQTVCAAIVSNEVSESGIINFLREKIAGFKIPKQFFFLDLIPRNEMGKVNRVELLKRLNLD